MSLAAVGGRRAELALGCNIRLGDGAVAEDFFEGLFGGEREAPEAAVGEARVGADAYAAALAADHAKYDPAVARSAKRFLDRQSRLIEAQTEELIEQRSLRLHHLKSQDQEGKLKRFGLQLRNGLQVFIGLIVAAVAMGVVVMVFDAFNTQAVVVEPFDAPPALAARGLTGRVLASGVLDVLTRLQAATRASATQRQLTNAWTSDIKVEVPETGISIGDLDRMLKARFGHDIHIDGDLVQSDDGGLALTIRGGGFLPKTFTGGAGDLDQLTTEAAEYVYGRSQPGLYATYLIDAGRNAEAVAFSKTTFGTLTDADKPFVLNSWANAAQNVGARPIETAPLYEKAISLKPDFWVAYSNLMNVDMLLQNEEAAWRLGQVMQSRAGGRRHIRPLLFQNLDYLTWNLITWRDEVLKDSEEHGGIGSSITAAAPSLADTDERLHDDADAELQLQTAQADASDPSVAAVSHFVHGRMAAEAGDTTRAVAEMEAFLTSFANPVVSSNYPGYTCWAAPAEEAAGHPDKADAVLKAAGRYVDCYRFRADILDHRGDWAGARKAYAQAVAIAPDLPAAYYSWGIALARHGDLAGAVAKFSAAHDHGPGWGDPLKAWGDILARQGQWREALGKYDGALRLAPQWPALRQARNAAARRAA